MTWLAALGLLPRRARVAGRVTLDGKNILDAPAAAIEAIRGRRVAMIFQDPASAFNPVLTIGHQIGEALACIGACAAPPRAPKPGGCSISSEFPTPAGG